MEKIKDKMLSSKNFNMNLSNPKIEQFNKELEEKIDSDDVLHNYIYSLTNDKEVIKKSYISIQRYLDSIKNCKNCKKLALCPNSDKGIIKNLTYNKYTNSIEDGFCKCEKLQQVEKILSNIKYSDIEKYEAYSLYTNVFSYLKQNRESNLNNTFFSVGKNAYSCVTKYSKDNSNKGCYIVSENSNGNNLVKSIAFFASKNKNLTCSIIDAKTLFTDLASNIPSIKNEAKENLNLALKSNVICILNLGLEYKNQAVISSVILPMFLDLKAKGKIIFISSYFKINDLVNSYFSYKNSNKLLLKKAIDDLVDEKILIDVEQF